MSYDDVAEKIYIPASTFRSWENKGPNFTGLSLDQEKAFRILAINQILEKEKTKFNIEVTLVKQFEAPAKASALDISSNSSSFIKLELE